MCAIALERLLLPERAGAMEFAKAFARIWSPFHRTTVAHAKRVKADPKFLRAQQVWPVCQKWAKELYEERNVFSHHRRWEDLAINWQPWQHLVLSAYTYPLVVKLLLDKAGIYRLSADERGRCYALEPLLDRWEPRAENLLNDEEDWSNYDDQYGRPTWSTIVGYESAIEKMARCADGSEDPG